MLNNEMPKKRKPGTSTPVLSLSKSAQWPGFANVWNEQGLLMLVEASKEKE